MTTAVRRPTPRSRPVALAALLVAACGFAGCGGSEGAKESAGTKSKGDGTEVASTGVDTPAGKRAAAVRKDAGGRKWFGDIPYDVWFAEPIAVAGNTTPVGAAAGPDNGSGEAPVPPAGDPISPAGDPVSPAGDPSPMPSPVPAAAAAADSGGGPDWGATIPAAVVDAEMTDAANRIRESVSSVATYNQTYLALEPSIHSMALMAWIAERHPGEIRWKEHAPVIRELATQMTALGTLMGGPKGKKSVEDPFVQIVDALAGSPPTGITPAPEPQISDIAEMGSLMKRLDNAFNKKLAIEVGDEAALKAKADLVRHEAGVIAAIAKAVVQPAYGFEGDDDFKGHAIPMIEAGIQAVEAANDGDFAKFDDAKTRINKACTDCHRSYR